MADKIVLVDTSILIDYYRKTDKENSVLVKLVRQNYSFAISAVTKYEIYAGATAAQISFWDALFEKVIVVPLDEAATDTAVSINAQLKRKRKQIAMADLFIAVTAIINNFPLTTLNKKHFDRVDELRLLD